jgi:hypothetical protein
MLPVAHTKSDIMLNQDEMAVSVHAIRSASYSRVSVLTSSSNSLNMVVICTTCAQANIDWSCKSRLSRAATRLEHRGKRKVGKRIGWDKALQVLRDDCRRVEKIFRCESGNEADLIARTHGTKK